MNYKIAEYAISIDAPESRAWKRLAWHYEPFITEETPRLQINVEVAPAPAIPAEAEHIYHEEAFEDCVSVNVHRMPDGRRIFSLRQPGETETLCQIELSAACNHAHVWLDEKNPTAVAWKIIASLTASLQLVYMLATYNDGILVTHSSCIQYQGKAYLFQGKSGTGKSTHSSLWLKHIEGTSLLNDDHPLIRIDADGTPLAYGSPWSGKTDCYVNGHAPIGGIVRIKRAPHNAIRRLAPVEAYASLITSLFSAPFDENYCDGRHDLIEKTLMKAPCYELECLPDEEAARVCNAGVTSKNQ